MRQGSVQRGSRPTPSPAASSRTPSRRSGYSLPGLLTLFPVADGRREDCPAGRRSTQVVRLRQRLHRGGHVPTANALICLVTTAVYHALNGAKSDMAFGRFTRFAKVLAQALLFSLPFYTTRCTPVQAQRSCQSRGTLFRIASWAIRSLHRHSRLYRQWR